MIDETGTTAYGSQGEALASATELRTAADGDQPIIRTANKYEDDLIRAETGGSPNTRTARSTQALVHLCQPERALRWLRRGTLHVVGGRQQRRCAPIMPAHARGGALRSSQGVLGAFEDQQGVSPNAGHTDEVVATTASQDGARNARVLESAQDLAMVAQSIVGVAQGIKDESNVH
ncbi:hypothetical protein FA95DRAFT_806059 [Auriscalpium vulgare]|uniref:Uncharacterized protein n=1 Tax=Auriscalpium vulgare TaxID=40419 RepID=A0ACB8RAI7_9AGAM|nr:hypothetical protein FA95DRAFT_806059 [Auriscalpium vulgare]